MIDTIKSAALQSGACDKINNVNCFRSLIKLMFTPQGIEFCQKHNFPSLEMFREDKDQVKDLNILVDAGEVTLSGRKYICLVGNTHATIEACDAYSNIIVIMHGAKATINASHYAGITVINISGDYFINKDNTAIVIYDRPLRKARF